MSSIDRHLRSTRRAKAAAVGLLLGVSALAGAGSAHAVAPALLVQCNGFSPAQAAGLGYEVWLGGAGSDTLGDNDATADFVMGFGGDDTIDTGPDGDMVCAGSGDDVVDSGGGSDHVYGDADDDDDTIDLGAGLYDHGYGGTGEDEADGGPGNDGIYGDDLPGGGAPAAPGDRDELRGGGGDDEIRGGDMMDTIFGNEGDDELYGDDGPDVLRGGDDEDELIGGDQLDTGYGGDGSDPVCDVEAFFTCP